MCNYMPITDVYAREILDSCGNPTVEVEILAEDGTVGRAAVPAGALAGRHEARELRDGGKRYGGLGVGKACHFVNTILAAAVIGENVYAQASVDRILCREDGTPDKRRLGANGILGVSMAVAATAAKSLRLPLFRYLGGAFSRRLPVPMVTVPGGGVSAENASDLREFMIMPCGADSFAAGLQMCSESCRALQEELMKRGQTIGAGAKRNFAPDLDETEDALTMILESVEKAGYRPGRDIVLALDVAAGKLFDRERGLYVFPAESRRKEREVCRSAEEMAKWLEKLCRDFPIASIEDGLEEEDWNGQSRLTERLGNSVQLVGDALFAAVQDGAAKDLRQKAVNAVRVSLNQTGTLTETFGAIGQARQNGRAVVISQSDRDTEDTLIADLAVAAGSGQIRAGSLCRPGQAAKYNRLLRIEDFLGRDAVYQDPFAL